jgi:Xaa-Pro aminopeptidase
MAERGFDAMLLTSPENLYYLTGLNHYGYFATTLLIVHREGPLAIIAREMELPTLRAQTPQCTHLTYPDGTAPGDTVVRALAAQLPAAATVGIELASMYLPADLWRTLERELTWLAWVEASGLLAEVRAVKSPAEVACVRAAARVSDAALQAGIAAAHAGATERDAAAAIYHRLITDGSDVPAFPPFVRASEAIPQEHVGWRAHRVLRHGDRVLFELGAAVARYHAPVSRIVYVGETPAGVDVSSQIVLSGMAAIRAALRPGAVAGEVYTAWHRAVSEGLGRPSYHRHHCGYLTGLGFPPTWTGGATVQGLRSGSELKIKEGMVFHVMSWLFGQDDLPDYGVSDTALVTAAGCELLTATARTPQVIR